MRTDYIWQLTAAGVSREGADSASTMPVPGDSNSLVLAVSDKRNNEVFLEHAESELATHRVTLPMGYFSISAPGPSVPFCNHRSGSQKSLFLETENIKVFIYRL